MNWREIRWGFNSLWYDRVQITIGAVGENKGKAWVDGVRVEEIGRKCCISESDRVTR
jgi:hypothetical protein